jgi:hypothetical protein
MRPSIMLSRIMIFLDRAAEMERLDRLASALELRPLLDVRM